MQTLRRTACLFALAGALVPSRPPQSRTRPLSVVTASPVTSISGNNVELTPSMKAYVEEKIGAVVEKYSAVAQRCDAHLSVMRNPSVSDSDSAEVVVFCKGEVVRAEERSPSMYSSIDLVADKVARKLRKVKERREGKRNKPKLKMSLAQSLEEDPVEAEAPAFDATTLIRRKKYDMPPQSLVDAMICMDGLDHDFYMFTNEDTGAINVIYKRKEGGLGLIEPEA